MNLTLPMLRHCASLRIKMKKRHGNGQGRCKSAAIHTGRFALRRAEAARVHVTPEAA